MSTINSKRFNLRRAQQEMEKGYHTGNWEQVRYWDTKLAEIINSACDDDNRDPEELIDDLEKILHSYGKMVAQLAATSKTLL